MNDRPVILVDLDGVVYPWVDTMKAILGERLERDLPTPTEWDVWKSWGLPEKDFKRLWAWAAKERDLYGHPDAAPIANAHKVLWSLSDEGWHIEYVTHRLNHHREHNNIIHQTVRWLEKHDLPFRGLQFTGNKTAIATAIVDDSMAYLKPAQARQRFLFSTPQNLHVETHMTGVTRVNGWVHLDAELL